MKKRAYKITFIAVFILSNLANAQWSGLGTGLAGYGLSSTVFHGELIVGGTFSSANGVSCNNIAKWNGIEWSPLSSGMSGGNTAIRALAVFRDTLYAAGQFATAGGVSVLNIAKWDGKQWSAVGKGLGKDYYNDKVLTLHVHQDRLIAGGDFRAIEGVLTNVAIGSWNGSNWINLGSADPKSPINGVNALATYQDNLYMGGLNQYAGLSMVAYTFKWNGVTWEPTAGKAGSGGKTNALIVYDNKLYAGGDFYNKVVYWDGAVWTAIAGTIDKNVYSFSVVGNDLYVGGDFMIAGTIPAKSVAKWNGSNWAAAGNGMDGYVFGMSNYNNTLFATGYFVHSDAIVTNGISKYESITTGLLNNDDNEGVVSMFPNPSNGVFTINLEKLNFKPEFD